MAVLSTTSRPELGLGLEHYTPLVAFALDPQAVAVAWDSNLLLTRIAPSSRPSASSPCLRALDFYKGVR
jgi:hypothetical protein